MENGERLRPARRPRSASSAASAAGDGSRSENTPRVNVFNECMRYFYEQLGSIQAKFRALEAGGAVGATHGDNESPTTTTTATPELDEFERGMWTLFFQLRPFLFLCFPSKQSAETVIQEVADSLQGRQSDVAAANERWDPAMAVCTAQATVDEIRKRFRPDDPHPGLRYTHTAHQVYGVAVRCTKLSPALALHAFLTLLSLLPKLADPSPHAAEQTNRYLDRMQFLLNSLRVWDTQPVYSLLQAMTSPAGLGVFLSYDPEWSAHGVFPIRRIRVLPADDVLARVTRIVLEADVDDEIPENHAWDVRNLFRSTIAPQSTQEALFVAYGLWRLIAMACREPHAVLGPSGVDVTRLVAQGCELLSLRFEKARASTAAVVSGASAAATAAACPDGAGASSTSPFPRPPLTTAITASGDDSCAAMTRSVHDAVGEFLANLAGKHVLSPESHGPQVLSSVVNYLYVSREQRGTPHSRSPPSWPLHLLQWVVSSVAASHDAGRPALWLASAVLAADAGLCARLTLSVWQLVSCAVPAVDGRGDSCGEEGSNDEEAAAGGAASPRESLLARWSDAQTASVLLSLLQHAMASHPDPMMREGRVVRAFTTASLLRPHVPALLSLRVPASLWLACQLRSSTLLSPAGVASALPGVLPAQILSLFPAVLSHVPASILRPVVEEVYHAAKHLRRPVSLLVEANVLAAVKAAPSPHLSNGDSDLHADETSVLSTLTIPAALQSTLQTLNSTDDGCRPEEVHLVIEAVTRLMQLLTTTTTLQEEESLGSAVVVEESQDAGGMASPERAATVILRSVEEYCVAHKTTYVAVPRELWALFYLTLTSSLRVCHPEEEDHDDAANIIRRACLVPKANTADMTAFAARLAGITCGVRRRLSRFLLALLQTHRDELSRQSHRRRMGLECVDESKGAEEGTGISAGLRVSLQALALLVGEAMLATRSFYSVVKFTTNTETPESMTVSASGFTSEAVVLYLFQQTALLHRQLFDAAQTLSLVEEAEWEPDTAAHGDARGVTDAVHHEEIVVDVDVDDDDDDDTGVEDGSSLPGRNEGPSSANGTTLDTARPASSLLGRSHDDTAHGVGLLTRLRRLHGEVLSALSLLLAGKHLPPTAALVPLCHRILCASLAIAPRSRDVDRIFCTDVLQSGDPVVYGGYAPLVILRLVTQRGEAFSLLEHSKEFTPAGAELFSPFLAPPAPTSPSSPASLERAPDPGADALLSTLRAFEAAFKQSWLPYLEGTEYVDSDDAAALSATARLAEIDPLTAAGPSGANVKLVGEGQRLLHNCEELYERRHLSFAVREAVRDVAAAVLNCVYWSPEDLCRHCPTVATSRLFIDLCRLYSMDCCTVIQRCADVVLAPLFFLQEETSASVAVRKLLQSGKRVSLEEPSEEGGDAVEGFAAAFAHLLYTCPTGEAKFAHLSTLFARAGIDIMHTRRVASKLLPSIVVHLISLEADAQLRCYTHRAAHRDDDEAAVAALADKDRSSSAKRGVRKSGAEEERQRGPPCTDLTDGVCFSVFSLALRQLVSLAECQESEADARRVLKEPASREDAAQALVSSLFDVLDSIDSTVTPNAAANPGDGVLSVSVVSTTTARRWLLGLSSFLQFLGEEATPLAAKLPPLLQNCAQDPLLTEATCHVWASLLRHCRERYLVDHAPDIVVDLVSLFRDGISSSAFHMLLRALQGLYQVTQEQSFWQAYFDIVLRTNRLIKALHDTVEAEHVVRRRDSAGRELSRWRRSVEQHLHHHHNNREEEETPESVAAVVERHTRVCTIMDGFLSIMSSSSVKTKVVFVRSLHDFLSSADMTLRLDMGRTAAANLAFVPALLRCAGEFTDPDDVECAFQCVGFVGAVAPLPIDSLPMNNTATRMQKPQHVSETSARADYYLTVPLVLDWRKLAAVLFASYCPRALANTTDPLMHDHAAYAVQELIKIYTDKERRENSGIALREDECVSLDELDRYVWWSGLNTHTRSMLAGFTTTRYTTRVWQQSDKRTPVYRRGMPFDRWVFTFFHALSLRCVGSFADVVKALRNAAKRESALLLFLLHMTVAQLVESGDEAVWSDITSEFTAIFDAAARAVPGDADRSLSDEAQRQRTGARPPPDSQQSARMSLRADGVAEMRTGDDMMRSAKRVRDPPVDEHVQCLLHLLEDLHHLQWGLLEMARPLSSAAELRRGDRNVEGGERANAFRLEQFYSHFFEKQPWWTCAQAAIDVGSHVRALRCIERQRQLPKVTDVMERVPLQRIFAALNDRDSAKAIHNLSRGLTPADAALSLENTGEWHVAKQNCELVLQHYPNSVRHQLTYLRCMRQLGQLHLMSRYAEVALEEARRRVVEAKMLTRDDEAWGCPRASHLLSVKNGNDDDGGDKAESLPLLEEWSVGVLQNYANEAAWRLGEWDRVRTDPSLPVSLAVPVAALMSTVLAPRSSTGRAPPPTWSTHSVAAAAASPLTQVCAAATRERAKLASPIRSACREGYAQAYAHVATLHALSDVELVAEIFAKGTQHSRQRGESLSRLGITPSRTPVLAGGDGARAVAEGAERERHILLDSVVTTLKARLELVEATLEAREPLLYLHRAIYRTLGLHQELADAWVEHAKLLKDGNFPDAALTAAEQASFYTSADSGGNAAYYVVTAELLHGMGRTAQAVEFAQNVVGDGNVSEAVRAKLQVRLANMVKDLGSLTPQETIDAYARAIELDPASEEAHHSLALFYDRLYSVNAQRLELKRQATANRDNVAQQNLTRDLVTIIENYAFKAAEHFGLALLRGVSTESISLPRLLTLWLDSTETLQKIRDGGLLAADRRATDPQTAISAFNRLVESLLLNRDTSQRIPTRLLMTQLSVLLSRLAHACSSVVTVITRIAVQLLLVFPQQTLWSVLPIAYSRANGGARAAIANRQILAPFAAAVEKSPVAATLQTATKLFEALLDFCRADYRRFGSGQGKLTQEPYMQAILQQLKSTPFLAPTVETLSPNVFADSDADVFVGTPTISGFADKVSIISSKQKPKRFAVTTEQGDVVPFLVKGDDEPRRDIRTMEVAFLLNTIFLKNPDARRKHFSLLRYVVAALNDSSAIIEWVPHLGTLRDVVGGTYHLCGKGVSSRQVQVWEQERVAGKTSRKAMMEKKILPLTPPVLHQWFDRNFRANQEWYQARTLYTQSTALWSMFGHIIGLGDRHCENLSLGINTGELVHVDFEAIFDHGETLNVPECVRFRLTQNIVDGMGILGAEGPFRYNCEIALRCQQENRKAIMSLVETFVHDPLVEWQKKSNSVAVLTAQQRMDRISRRLDGYLDLYGQERDSLALNVEGQVAKLISHASAPENLCEMYTWWMPWI